MTDPSPPPSEPRERDDRIGAWLDGELSTADDEAFADEIATDPELADRVEAIRAVRERLIGAETGSVPAGFADRVHQAVAAAGAGTGPRTAPAGEVTEIERLRERRARRRRLGVVGSVAALLVAVAVVAPMVTGLGPPSDEVAMEAEDAVDAPPASPDDPDGDVVVEHDREPTADEPSGVARTSVGEVPLVVDEQAVFTSPSALIDHLDARAEAVELLGAPADEAERVAAHTDAVLADAEPFHDDTRPGTCVAHVTGGHDGPAVTARVERLVLDAEPLTAHLVVSGEPGGPLERVDAVVVDPDVGCATRLSERLE